MSGNDDKLVEWLLRKGTMPTHKECKLDASHVGSLCAAERSNESEQTRHTGGGNPQGAQG